MSASRDRHRSGEEGNNSTSPNSSSSGQIHYDPFSNNNPARPSIQSERYAESRQRPISPVGNDRPRRSPSEIGRNRDMRSLGLDSYPLRTQYFPSSPPTTEQDAFFLTSRSATDRSQLFGPGPEGQGFHNYPALSPGNPYPEEHEGSSLASETPSVSFIQNSRPPRYSGRDDFSPAQWLPSPSQQQQWIRSQALPQLPTSLSLREQDDIIHRANDFLSHCAYHFVAKYEFPIPIERNKCTVRQASDREWTEWAFLLKRLATKRRIPARVLLDNQIRQLVTTLENSLFVRQATNTATPRQPRDDRYVLQLLSAGTQVARILQDSMAMQQLSQLYLETEALILEKRNRISSVSAGAGLPRSAMSIHGPVGRAVGRGGGGGVGGGSGGGGGTGGGGSSSNTGGY